MSPTEWLRSAVKERWWSLPDSHLRVAMTLVAMADNRGVVETTGDAMAERCGASRSSVRRAFDALADSGFCTVQASRGRGQSSTITIVSLGHFIQEQDRVVSCENPNDVAISTRPLRMAESGHLEVTEIVRVSLADHGDRGHFGDRKLAIFESSSGKNAPDPPIFPRASDQDLLGSPKTLRSDLRSTDPEIITRSVPTSTSPKQEPMETDQAGTEGQPTETVEPTSPGKPKRRRIDPDKIPERAWAAADYLRHKALAKNPAAVAGMKPWQYGWSWETGKPERVGEGSRTGMRLAWANSFRLFHAVLQGALANAKQPSTDEYTWAEIAKTVHWLFHSQPSGVGFVVECPDSLRTKWDRIQECRASSPKRAGGSGLSPPVSDSEVLAARNLLDKLSRKSRVTYTAMPQHVEIIARQLRSGVTEREMEAVIAYCDDAWRKPELRQHLRPETLFGQESIAKYLDAARSKYAWQLASGGTIGAALRVVSPDEEPPTHPMFISDGAK